MPPLSQPLPRTAASRLSRRALLAALPMSLASRSQGAAAQPVGLTPMQSIAGAGVALSGVYPGHLQGVCTNDRDAFYWSMTTHLVKTDVAGAVIRQIAVPSHHGDLCHVDGKIYVAVNLALFNDPQKRSDSWSCVYDGADLSLLARHAISEVIYGAGGVAFGESKFIVVGGLPDGVGENYIYQYDQDFASGQRISLQSGQTYKGIQTAAYDGDHWWFGCYGKPAFTEVLIRTDRTFGAVQSFAFDASTGLVPLDRDTFLVAKAACGKESCVAVLAPAALNAWVESGRLRAI
jgi:hypothetical protein